MTQKHDSQHVLGFAFIVIALIMMIQGLWLGQQQENETQCQADYNAQSNAVQKQRAEWADQDRDALNQMIFTVIDPHTSNQQKQNAVNEFAQTARKNDANRRANPLPSRTSCG